VETPVASIGVRGTQYLLRLCEEGCGDAPGGLYGGVSQGRIAVANKSGSRTFGGDRFFHVASATDRPRGILQPPKELMAAARSQGKEAGSDEGSAKGEGSEGGEPASTEQVGGMLNTLADQADTIDVTPVAEGDYEASEEVDDSGDSLALPESETVSSGSGTASSSRDVLFAYGYAEDSNPNLHMPYAWFVSSELMGTVTVDSNGYLTAMEVTDPTTGSVILDFSANSGATPVEAGQDSAGLGVSWGRWQAGDYTVSNATLADGAYAEGDFHYAYSDNLTTPQQLGSLSGSATYAYSGGTTPTDQTGNQWQVDTLSMQVDFDQAQISGASLAVSDTSGTKQPISVQLQAGVEAQPSFYLPLASTSGSGVLAGRFVGAEADGAAVSFSVQDADQTVSVSGAGALTKQ